MAAQVLHMPPTAPGWYINLAEGSGGLGNIYVHTDSGVWVRGGRELPASQIPPGLKKLGVVA